MILISRDQLSTSESEAIPFRSGAHTAPSAVLNASATIALPLVAQRQLIGMKNRLIPYSPIASDPASRYRSSCVNQERTTQLVGSGLSS